MPIEDVLLTLGPQRWKTERAIVFDWNDGPRHGIASLAFPTCGFVFDLLEERYNPDGLNDRLFRLRELPVGSVESVVKVLAELGEPANPVWLPVWKFASEAGQQKAERSIDAILAASRQTDLVILSRDLEHFEGIWVIGTIERSQADWFRRLRIP